LKDQPLHEWPPRTQGEHEARESDLRHPCRLLHCIGRSARDDIPGEPADRVIGAGKSSRPRRPALLVSPDAWRRRRLGPNTMSTPAWRQEWNGARALIAPPQLSAKNHAGAGSSSTPCGYSG